MSAPRTDTPAPATLRSRVAYERRRQGLCVVAVTVHQSRRAEIEAIAAQMQEPVDNPANPC
jgi:hypothetical protein